MDYLKKAFSRPFQDWKKFGIATVIYLVLLFSLTMISAAFFDPFDNAIAELTVGESQIGGELTEEQVAARYAVLVEYLPSLAIGTLLIFLVGLIIAPFLQGWFLRCINSALKNKNKLPNWNNFLDLYKKGFFLGIIQIIYGIILIIPLFLIEVAPIIATVLAAILLFLLIYNLPMIEVFYARNYKFKDAFKIKEMYKKSFTGKYLGNGIVIFLILLGINLASSIVAEILAITIILPILVNTFIYVYSAIFFSTVFAKLYLKIK